MSEYKLELKQVVDYPRCRIYRQFIRTLMENRNIRSGGCSGLFYYTVLCSYANFRTSYKRVDGINYTIYPGEWVCSINEVKDWFRAKTKRQTWNTLDDLQERHLISYVKLDRDNFIKFRIKGWHTFNTILEYHAPCQKDTGFFFLPISTVSELVGAVKCSEMDIVLDLWINAVYNDERVQGSEACPVVYMRNGSGSPLVCYSNLAHRWGISKATVGRVLKKLEEKDYLTLLTFAGRQGSIICLNNYLSTMFQVSDVLIDKEEIAMTLNIRLNTNEVSEDNQSVISDDQICVSEMLSSVSKSLVKIVIEKVVEILEKQGFICSRCSQIRYMLYPLSTVCRGGILSNSQQFIFTISCKDRQLLKFELGLIPIINSERVNYDE